MLIEILTDNLRSAGALKYNEDKVSDSKACVTAVFNMESDSRFFIKKTFRDFESNLAIPPQTRRFVFHFAVNPGPEDMANATDENITSFVKDYLNEIGYAEQPAVIYRHADIERKHYHVVTPTVTKEGKVIHGNFNGTNLSYKVTMEIVRELCPRYGFVFAEKNDRKHQASERTQRTLTFDPTEANVYDNLLHLFTVASRMPYRSREEFLDILYSMRLTASWTESRSGRMMLSLQGVDAEGRKNSPLFQMEKKMQWNANARFEKGIENTLSGNIDRTWQSQEELLVSIVSQVCLNGSGSFEEFRKRMDDLGLCVIVRREGLKDHEAVKPGDPLPEIRSLTIIDRFRRGVFSGDSIERFFSVEVLRKMERVETWSNTAQPEIHRTLVDDKTKVWIQQYFEQEARRMGLIVSPKHNNSQKLTNL